MYLQRPWWSGLVAAVPGRLVGVRLVGAAGEQFIPILSMREGAVRSAGSPLADGYIAYVTLLNARDGGINGVPLVWEFCETVFDVDRSVECYERLKGKGPGLEADVGTVYWIRGLLQGFFITEAIRRAMREFGNQPLTGAQVQWGLEHLSLTPAYLQELGAEGLLPPLTLSCRNHDGSGGVKFQQWDGTKWMVLTDWIAPDQALVRPLVEASAAKYAQEKGITPRDCP